MDFAIHTDKSISETEYARLMESVTWGSGYSGESIRRSLAAYPFVAHARSGKGELVGFVSAFSDGAFSTLLGELVVRPDSQRKGIGRALLQAVERNYVGIPVYAKPLGQAALFFAACGYREPSVPMKMMFNRNGAEG